LRQKFYSGVGGIGLILNEVYRLYQDENAKAGAMEILDHYLDTSTEDNEEIYWSDNSPVFFDSGNILYLLDCCNTYKELSSKLNEIIVKATNHILNQAIDHKDGGLEIDHLHIDFKHKEPNFEFGTAGMVVALLQIYCLEKNKNEIVGLIDDPYYK